MKPQMTDAPKGVGEAPFTTEELDRLTLVATTLQQAEKAYVSRPSSFTEKPWGDAQNRFDNAFQPETVLALIAAVRQARAATTAASPGGWDREALADLAKTLHAKAEEFYAMRDNTRESSNDTTRSRARRDGKAQAYGDAAKMATALLAASPQPPVQPGAHRWRMSTKHALGGSGHRPWSLGPLPETLKHLPTDHFEVQPLYTAPPVQPGAGWLPIESAPKDGTEVDLWLAPISEEGINLTPCRVPNAHFHCGDWLVWSATDECEPCWIVIKHRITHWQPLPSPPVTEGT